ncbi:hypothetical protein ACLOJK_028328 [Asimina triloba]
MHGDHQAVCLNELVIYIHRVLFVNSTRSIGTEQGRDVDVVGDGAQILKVRVGGVLHVFHQTKVSPYELQTETMVYNIYIPSRHAEIENGSALVCFHTIPRGKRYRQPFELFWNWREKKGLTKCLQGCSLDRSPTAPEPAATLQEKEIETAEDKQTEK